MIRRQRIATRAEEHPAVGRYLATGRYPVQGRSRAEGVFSQRLRVG